MSHTHIFPSLTPSTEIQHYRSAISEPAGGTVFKPPAGPPPEWGPGPDVDWNQAHTAAKINQQALPVLPQHQELQLLHLPDSVRLVLCLRSSLPSVSQLLSISCLCAGWTSSVTISLRWMKSEESGSTHSLCTPFCLETESTVNYTKLFKLQSY